MASRKLSLAELRYLAEVVRSHIESDISWGNRDQFLARQFRVADWIDAAIAGATKTLPDANADLTRNPVSD